MKKKIADIEKRIERIKKELNGIGEMRPGSLSKQFNICGTPGCKCKDPKNPKKHGPYYQLSYTHKRKSTTQFIRPQFVDEVERQIKTYKTFRKLIDEWIDLALKHSKMKLEMAKLKLPK